MTSLVRISGEIYQLQLSWAFENQTTTESSNLASGRLMITYGTARKTAEKTEKTQRCITSQKAAAKETTA